VIILIDGYNLLKQLFPSLKEKLDKQRNQLIQQLSYYKSQKSAEITEIILVFDGGISRHATREIHNGIVEIFAGQNSSADDWIINFVEKNKEKELLIVSLDKGLISQCQKYGADSINVFDFYKILQNRLLENLQESQAKTESITLQKYKDIHGENEYDYKTFDKTALDLLMEQASINASLEKQDDLLSEKELRKSKSKTKSKQEKKLYKKFKKL
jgi:predicted RNA-binding protein with PIN domain